MTILGASFVNSFWLAGISITGWHVGVKHISEIGSSCQPTVKRWGVADTKYFLYEITENLPKLKTQRRIVLIDKWSLYFRMNRSIWRQPAVVLGTHVGVKLCKLFLACAGDKRCCVDLKRHNTVSPTIWNRKEFYSFKIVRLVRHSPERSKFEQSAFWGKVKAMI